MISYYTATETKTSQVELNEYHHAEENEMLYLYFDRIYDFTKQNEEIICKILLHNSEIGYMFSSFRNFLNNIILYNGSKRYFG